MDNLTLSSSCEEITMFSEDLPQVVCNLTSSKIKTDNILSKDVEERSWCLEVGGGDGDRPCFLVEVMVWDGAVRCSWLIFIDELSLILENELFI